MNITKILDMIRSCPGIRTVQISDRLDCDIQQLQETLRGLVSENKIRGEDTIGPNNRKAIGWHVVGDASSAAVPKSAGEKVSVSQMLLDFVREQGSASNAQLRAISSKHSTSHPAALLAHAASKGLVKCNGGLWTAIEAATAIPESAENPAPAPESQSTVPVAEPVFPEHEPRVPPIEDLGPAHTAELPAFLEKGEAWTFRAAKANAADPLLQATDGDFECALWSDGKLQMVRAGAEIAKLTADETRKLLAYLERMAVEEAA